MTIKLSLYVHTSAEALLTSYMHIIVSTTYMFSRSFLTANLLLLHRITSSVYVNEAHLGTLFRIFHRIRIRFPINSKTSKFHSVKMEVPFGNVLEESCVVRLWPLQLFITRFNWF